MSYVRHGRRRERYRAARARRLSELRRKIPGNILYGSEHLAKIGGFGLAVAAEQNAETRNEIFWTPYYLAPERLNSEPEDFRSDIYSPGRGTFPRRSRSTAVRRRKFSPKHWLTAARRRAVHGRSDS